MSLTTACSQQKKSDGKTSPLPPSTWEGLSESVKRSLREGALPPVGFEFRESWLSFLIVPFRNKKDRHILKAKLFL
jgi:hypothetical protein